MSLDSFFRSDYLYIVDALSKGDVILFSDLDHLVVWSGGTTARVYEVRQCSIIEEVDCFTFGHGLDPVTQAPLLRLAAEEATKIWHDAREAAREELYVDFPF